MGFANFRSLTGILGKLSVLKSLRGGHVPCEPELPPAWSAAVSGPLRAPPGGRRGPVQPVLPPAPERTPPAARPAATATQELSKKNAGKYKLNLVAKLISVKIKTFRHWQQQRQQAANLVYFLLFTFDSGQFPFYTVHTKTRYTVQFEAILTDLQLVCKLLQQDFLPALQFLLHSTAQHLTAGIVHCTWFSSSRLLPSSAAATSSASFRLSRVPYSEPHKYPLPEYLHNLISVALLPPAGQLVARHLLAPPHHVRHHTTALNWDWSLTVRLICDWSLTVRAAL